MKSKLLKHFFNILDYQNQITVVECELSEEEGNVKESDFETYTKGKYNTKNEDAQGADGSKPLPEENIGIKKKVSSYGGNTAECGSPLKKNEKINAQNI